MQGWAEDATSAYTAAIRMCPRNDDAALLRAAQAHVAPAAGGGAGRGVPRPPPPSTAQLAMLFALRATGHTRGLRWGAVVNDVHAAVGLGLGHAGLQKEAQVGTRGGEAGLQRGAL